MKRLAGLARTHGVELTTIEGGSHTKVTVGSVQTTVPRHAEINELTARGILRHVESGLASAALVDGQDEESR
jgi:hypothetical protein